MSLQYGEAKVEVIDGKEFMMSPPAFSNHNYVKANIYNIFKNYLKGNICVPHADGQKVVLPSQKKGDYLVPDFFVVCDRSKIKPDGVYGSPDLIAEVLSPKTTKMDRGKKKELYRLNAVKEYWIVDPVNKMLEVYLLKDSNYELNEVYRYPNVNEDDAETEDIKTIFTVNLFPDMAVDLQDVFEYVDNWNWH